MQDIYGNQSRKTAVTIVVALLALALVSLVGFRNAGLLGIGSLPSSVVTNVGGKPVSAVEALGSEPKSSTLAQSPESPAVLNAKPDDSSVTTLATGPEDIPWMKHLERCEHERNRIAQGQLAAFMVRLTMLQGTGATDALMKGLLGDDPLAEPETTPAKQVSEETLTRAKEWETLIADFESMAPPEDCVAARNAYSQTLRETQAMMEEIVAVVDGASADPQAAVSKLMRMQGTSGNRIDIAAKETDRQVQLVCDAHKVRKWFSIQSDIGSGLFSGFSGIGH